MRYLKECRLLCCVYLLVAGIGTLALRNNKVDGGTLDIQGKPEGREGVKEQKEASNKNNILDSIVIPQDALESAKSVCEGVVIKGKEFKEFCKNTFFFKEIQLIKKNEPNLYGQISGESYESTDTSSFQVLKDEGDKKVVMENDKHNPKISILFLFQKMCVGGIPLACTNILKVDNMFDVNQTEQQGGGSADKAEEEEVESEITGSAEEGSQGVSESVTDLTEEKS
ncbi:hypothetical protein C922_04675 [Plasmodium inui San Antonio 1]|uniref:Rhoptry neck protein 12 n=1 Tax=Plasmodium inui San Antonio 1 TaxID=1237626 RepID=W7A083_9APIC|nr:hypothetical protein C922_04675 [Plasmodium inui San Antonio 1]EUD64943.1 hypothetical protein C922_04675 [Plasmodium inui San Antonio 1]